MIAACCAMLRRINKELQSAPRTGSIRFIAPDGGGGGCRQHWQITCGAGQTQSFDGLTLDIHVEIPVGYPFKCPTIKVLQKIYHPNFDETGRMCLGGDWAPNTTVYDLIQRLHYLIMFPDPEAVLCQEAYDMFNNDRPRYIARVLGTCACYGL